MVIDILFLLFHFFLDYLSPFLHLCSTGDFRKVLCLHCGTTISRGSELTPRKKCYNRGMQAHIESKHKDLLSLVIEAQARLKPGERKIDPKDETVRGPVPLFNLRTQADREAFMKLVRMTRYPLHINVILTKSSSRCSPRVL
jgi:hypothetical protein